MKFQKTTLAASAIAAGALLAISAPLSASAHVSVGPSSTAAGSYTVLTFSLGHGCEGAATTALTIDIPESIASVTPTVNPNWDVSKVDVDLDEPLKDSHGNEITTRVGQIVYTAKTPLADGFRDTVELSLQLPADAAGETLAFPVLQSCEVGETNWNEIAEEGAEEPESPAPVITVTEATDDAHGHDASADSEETVAENAAETDAASGDVLARVLGIGGLVVGAVGIVLAVTARRKTSA